MMRSLPALAVSTVLAAIAGVAGEPAFIAAVVVLWFLAVVPGALLCRILRFDGDGAYGWTVTIAVSFALDVLISETLVYLRVWTPLRALLSIVAVAFVSILVLGMRSLVGMTRRNDAPLIQGDGVQ